MNLRKFVPACDDSPVRVLTTVSLRLGSWPLLLVAPRPRLVAPNATARASVSFQSNARTSFSVTPSRRIRSRIAVSPNSSSRDGSVQHPVNMTSSHHSSATANRMSVNSTPRNLARDDKTEATCGRGQESAVGFACRPSGIHPSSAA